jgi:putative tricarboxylic transport membrane protein
MVISGGNLAVFVERGTSLGILVFIAFLLSIPLVANPIRLATQRALQAISARRRAEPVRNGNDREHVA